MSIVDVHARLGNAALFYTIIMALWGLWRFFRRQDIDSSYWGALVIAEILYILQSGLGAFLFFTGIGVLARGYIHILYGVVAVLVVPGVFFFTRGDEQRRALLIYSVGFLFLVGVVLRAIATGGAA